MYVERREYTLKLDNSKMKLICKLTNRELDVLKILWNAEKPMVASEISKKNPELNINTIQAVLKKLKTKNIIDIDSIVYSGTVLTRSYIPKITASEYTQMRFCYDASEYKQFISKSDIVAAFLDNDDNPDELINELESLILKRRNELKEE